MGNPKKKTLIGRLRHGWDNIKMNIKETGRDGVDVIDLFQDSRKWRAFMKTVMNLTFQKKTGRFFFDYLRLLKKDPAQQSSENIQDRGFTYQQTFMRTPFTIFRSSFFNASVYEEMHNYNGYL